MNLLERVHDRHVYGRRVRVLAGHLSQLLPESADVLDVGCGDGLVASSIAERRPDVRITGVDAILRSQTRIPAIGFDGSTLPFPDQSFDVVMVVDVLHHANDPLGLLHEACRVSRGVLLIKDHLLEGLLAGPTLKFMDRIGNARYGVPMPGDYWPRQRWDEAFRQMDLRIDVWLDKLGLYPPVIGWGFERSLHFIARLVAM